MGVYDAMLSTLGIDVDSLPDRLHTTMWKAVCEKLGVDTSDMNDNLISSYCEQICTEYCASGGSGGSGGGEQWFNDGDTHIWITLDEGRTSPVLGCCPNGTVTVDWGDGTTPDILTGTSRSAVKWTPNHEYAAAGDYVITLKVDGEVGFSGASGSGKGTCLLRYTSDTDARNCVYENRIKKIEFGNGVTYISGAAFYYCYSLAEVVMSEGVTSIQNDTFYGCYSLANIVIPEGVTSIGNTAFYQCQALASVVFPQSVTQLGNYTFQACSGVKVYDFTQHTIVPTLKYNNVFYALPADCEIRVPAALYDEWIAATNWTTYADKIVAV